MNILNKLTIKHLKMNKKRTIVTIVGVILSTALMVGIGLLFATVRDNSIKMIIDSDGSHHTVIKMTNNNLETIKNDNSIKSYTYYSYVGFTPNDTDFYYRILSANKEYFKNVKLISGTLPTNNREIIVSSYSDHYYYKGIKVGDEIEFNIGDIYDKDEKIFESGLFTETQVFKSKEKRTYKVVGIYDGSFGPNSALDIYTVNDDSEDIYTFITYKNINKAYTNSLALAEKLGLKNKCTVNNNIGCYGDVDMNTSLLSMYGVSGYSNVTNSMTSIIIIILSLVSIGCIIVIYNSFAISVMERKKQFGLFSSIGATKKQLRHTVIYEAIIIGLIGIPIGILSGIFGIWVVLQVINNLLPDIFGSPLALSLYPLFIYIPVIFMIITILVSALIPSFMASRVSPITAIRQNDDIKIKNKKVKTPKFIRKIFGIEGELALKNMKRNKKKYRITIISLFISIVLYISFTGFASYGIKSIYRFAEIPEYDLAIYSRSGENGNYLDENKIATIINNEDVKKYTTEKRLVFYTKKLDKNMFNKKYYDNFLSEKMYNPEKNTTSYAEYEEDYMFIDIHVLDNKSYNDYRKKLGINNDSIIAYNIYQYMEYTNTERISKEWEVFDNLKLDKIYFANSYDRNGNTIYSDTSVKLDNIYLTNELPFGLDGTTSNDSKLTLIISEDMMKSLKLDKYANDSIHIYLKANPYKNIDKLITDYQTESDDISYANIPKEMELISNVILVMKILLYGFIGLVTLIGVTSVFNTINTSIALRRKEFSVLRSIGLTPKGFNKILYFESIFFGIKSLLYAIPVSLVVVYLLHKAFGSIVEFSMVMIPWMAIIEAIIGVFVIVLLSMMYASSKIKHENILDAIREENI